MTWGGQVLRVSIFLNVGLVLSLLAIYAPQSLQKVASSIFYWETDPTQQVWSFVGVLIGVATLVLILSEGSIKRGAVRDYEASH